MIWNIVTDSSCDLKQLNDRQDDTEVRYASVPFIISVDDKDFIDDEQLTVSDMLDAMESSRAASHTSCPTPHSWQDAFSCEGNVIAITISKELSGSYNSACVARDMVLEDHPDKKILVVNSASAGPALICLIRELHREIMSGHAFEVIAEKATDLVKRMNTVFALCSFDNLVKNGRMSKVAGFLAKTLGFWGIGIASPEGRIVIKGKERSNRKAVTAILNDMRSHGAPQKVIISHCENSEMAERIREAVESTWEHAKVEIFPTKGLCSYYADRHGLLVSYL